MHGLMMESELLISSILRHADKNFGDREIVSVTADNPLHRYTYADCCRRTRQLANAMAKLGLDHGDRIATLADPRLLARFKNEVRAAATLDHPNIVTVHSVGE